MCSHVYTIVLLSLFNSTEPRYPPVFDKKLIPVDVTVGDTVDLECHMTGSLPIKVTWSKDHKDIRTGGNYKISCVDNTPHLTILKADKADSGRYSCHASNDIGKDSCSTEVSVKGIWSLLFGVTVFTVFIVLGLTCGALFLLRLCLPFFMPLHL